MVLKNNLVPNFAIIDVDINKSLDEEQRKSIRDDFISKLSKDDVIIKSGSGGLHIYCIHDIESAYKNRYIACVQNELYSIDYLTSVEPDKQSLIMLPFSNNGKGFYQFVQGTYNSVLKRTSSQILHDLNLNIEFERKKVPVQTHFVQTYCNLTSEYQQLLVDGLSFNVPIHATARKIDDGLSIYNLIQAVNVMNDEYRQIAYDNIRSNPNLTEKSSNRFDQTINDCIDKIYPLPVLLKIIRIYNNDYYTNVLMNSSIKKYI